MLGNTCWEQCVLIPLNMFLVVFKFLWSSWEYDSDKCSHYQLVCEFTCSKVRMLNVFCSSIRLLQSGLVSFVQSIFHGWCRTSRTDICARMSGLLWPDGSRLYSGGCRFESVAAGLLVTFIHWWFAAIEDVSTIRGQSVSIDSNVRQHFDSRWTILLASHRLSIVVNETFYSSVCLLFRCEVETHK